MPSRTIRASAVELVVADMRASVAFYRRLGVDFASDTDDHEEAELAPGLRLMLDTEASLASFAPGWVRPTGSARASLAFEVGTPAEVDALHAELVAAGAHSELEPWDAFWGQRYASLTDPDGNGIDIHAPLDAARATSDPEG
ncbi:VOC family protein [Actinotalea ferrariae]|nr:VOC family protein [Actinotalea ferrariae]